MFTAFHVLLTLKIAVAAVTVLLLLSIAALLKGKYRLHGRINVVFFVLTLIAVLGLEAVIRFSAEDQFAELRAEPWLLIHLCFSVPALVLMFAMLISGKMHSRRVHLTLSVFFGIAWVGTFITGIFFL